MEKVKLAVDYGAESIMDLSNYGKTHDFRRALIDYSPAMIGTVPMYDAVGLSLIHIYAVYPRSGEQQSMMKKIKINPSKMYVSRRLASKLGRIADYPLSVIEAPMGYGKTMGMRSYLKENDLAYICLLYTSRCV